MMSVYYVEILVLVGPHPPTVPRGLCQTLVRLRNKRASTSIVDIRLVNTFHKNTEFGNGNYRHLLFFS